MKTISINLYSFDELSSESKENAIKNVRNRENDYDYIWGDAHTTVKAFHKIFPTSEGRNSWLDYRIDGMDYQDEIFELTNLRLRTYILNNFGQYLYAPKWKGSLKTNEYVKHKRIKSPLEVNSQGNRNNPYYSAVFFDNDCILSGVCYDNDLLEPIYTFIETGFKSGGTTLEDLFKNCFKNLRKTIDDEIEHKESDEGITEEIHNNDYEFTEDGSIYEKLF